MTKSSEKQLTREAFLAIVVYELTHSTGHWHWLCLNKVARKEMLDDASAAFEEWKAKELEMERRREAI